MTLATDPNFNPVPSASLAPTVSVVADLDPGPAAAQILLVSAAGPLPAALSDRGVDRDGLSAVGFEGKPGQSVAIPGTPALVAVGTGADNPTVDQVRDAAAAGARGARKAADLVVDLRGAVSDEALEAAAAAAVEGTLLARYQYLQLKEKDGNPAVETLTLLVPEDGLTRAEAGAERGAVLARSTALARDLANTPPRHLNAEKFASVVAELAPKFGLQAEVFGREELEDFGLGGLLGTNAGSVDEPRMVKVTYQPAEPKSNLALVGKGIMYDSGGISLKPSDGMHALMKFDMSGAAAVFSAMTALADLGVQSRVTGWLMCTDNMPSGSATKLGDVLTIRGGKTVEVKNTDAEGRLVLADGLVLATEEWPEVDAIVDIATLTGSAMMALGTRRAAIFANNDQVASQLEVAGAAADEPVWQLPMEETYREQLKSDVADLANIGGRAGGAILAALFLSEFVDDVPWGHIDIAGPMNSDKDDSWRTKGATGYGTRLLINFAESFEAPTK